MPSVSPFEEYLKYSNGVVGDNKGGNTMGYILDGLRKELSDESGTNWFGRKKTTPPKDGALLYLFARNHDSEDKAKDMEKLAHATEMAAIDIIGRYDSDGSLVREFKNKIELRKGHL